MHTNKFQLARLFGSFALCVGACADERDSSDPAGLTGPGSGSSASTGAESGNTSQGGTDGGGSDSAAGTAGPGTSGDPDGLPRLDVGAGSAGSGGESDAGGCQKVDFLFVIDNSGSMLDEQQNLVASFPGFISTIQTTLQARDYQIMVVDTDAEPGYGGSLNCSNNVCTCMPEPECCYGLCSGPPANFPVQPPPPPPDSCGGKACADWVLPTGCPVTLGSGRAENNLYQSCNFAEGHRYMTDAEPDLNAAFECAALVGAGGSGNERPMDAMRDAIGPLGGAGQCNEGFVRDDAILVVTFITDEAEGGSTGDPGAWRQALVDAKGGDESAIVVLGLVGEPGCAEPAPRLQQFASSFTHGQWASICQPDYAPFFDDAVSVIDAACDDFVPPG